MNSPSSGEPSPLSAQLNALRNIVRKLTSESQNNIGAILTILRELESVHQEVRVENFEKMLPRTRHELYPLLKEIEEQGGWPYIERMKLQTLISILDLAKDLSNIPMPITINPIKFGTDGWRGVIAADFTFERVAHLAPLAAIILEREYGSLAERRIIVGYDRRFLAQEFAQVAAEAIAAVGYEVWLSDTYAPTPAFSWAAKAHNALGAIVLTASHNPAKYLGLKVKGAFGGSVGPEVTEKIEALLSKPPIIPPSPPGIITTFDPWLSYCQELQTKVNLEMIQNAVIRGELKIFSNPMYGSASGGLQRLLNVPITEVNNQVDPLFGGKPPEPLPRYIGAFLEEIKNSTSPEKLRIGLVFDGDADRIAAVDSQGGFLSSQNLIPILIEHLASRKGLTGEIIKTVSGSDLFVHLAELYKLPLFETAIGYKYIADRMLTSTVLIGGEESGGIGYGTHIPERDALLSALYVLEAVVESGKDLSILYRQLQEKTGFFSDYDRIDLPLASMSVRNLLLESLQNNPPQEIAQQNVIERTTIDGYKFRLADGRWLLIRFSGTEPVLRLYCEAANAKTVQETLEWAKNWANSLTQ